MQARRSEGQAVEAVQQDEEMVLRNLRIFQQHLRVVQGEIMRYLFILFIYLI